MNSELQEKVRIFESLNEISLKGEIVFFGCKDMVNFPFYELINKCNLEHALYNRSICDLSIKEAYENIDVCVLNIKPKKVFLALDPKSDEDSKYYKKLVDKIFSVLPHTQLYLLSCSCVGNNDLNKQIAGEYKDKKVKAILLHGTNNNKMDLYKTWFKQLAGLFRDRELTISDVFDIVDL